ncbi:hypothetical protein FOPG_13649 [Fusarium oxysporum f. sp. conglutinans race 2 54008]|uniref:Heterokaryon incompatibility domain-containing protein n=2 Tax=Fusarium oxysporum f. sp. conglutinans TaxID=100902 RepID=F9FCP2_FUSOF|nr:hypothetical protein FOXB_04170 [Fusarium oxysporum f. sp. conglutinans Fo5176]EXL70527.1 hypothetical protein FOPG_13649 [Fusarium oxysporum f. sp. conglutinans race 2 54008]KAG6991484.1 Heterokaryon incompatibility protein 6, OR allele [Fusarium oxysporum f. sp. conglutinans]KAI8419624.1 hypothetical protein FOFC_02213 [Fusarium oxysporum]
MAASDFKHVELKDKQIRLLTLDKNSAQVSCKLTIHNFEECPDYFALSYAWGPPPPECEISLNDHKFMIRENLFNCLSSFLRRPHRPTPTGFNSKGNTAAASEVENACFWIDQICIDQTNIPERNQQVSMMDKIYTRSKETVVWVGTEKIEEMDFSYDPFKSEIHTLFLQPYWTRLWIVQEILLSKRIAVRHGDESYDWDLLDSLGRDVSLALVHHHPDRHEDTLAFRRQGLFNGLPTAAGCLLNEKSNVFAGLDGHKLSDLLLRFGDSKCENPLDKVYALQGLLKLQPRVKIDYSISPETLFYQVVDKIAKDEGDSLMEEAQLDVCLALQRALNVAQTKQSSENVAKTVFSYVIRRLSNVDEPLSPEEETAGLEYYVRYLQNPGLGRIPQPYRINDFGKTYREFKLDQLLSVGMARAKLSRLLKEGPQSIPRQKST